MEDDYRDEGGWTTLIERNAEFGMTFSRNVLLPVPTSVVSVVGCFLKKTSAKRIFSRLQSLCNVDLNYLTRTKKERKFKLNGLWFGFDPLVEDRNKINRGNEFGGQ